MSSPRWLRIDFTELPTRPPGTYTDFEGCANPDEVLAMAGEMWAGVVREPPEDDPHLWAVWLHYVFEQVDQTGPGYVWGHGIEVLYALFKFLGRDRGVFMVPDVDG